MCAPMKNFKLPHFIHLAMLEVVALGGYFVTHLVPEDSTGATTEVRQRAHISQVVTSKVALYIAFHEAQRQDLEHLYERAREYSAPPTTSVMHYPKAPEMIEQRIWQLLHG